MSPAHRRQLGAAALLCLAGACGRSDSSSDTTRNDATPPAAVVEAPAPARPPLLPADTNTPARVPSGAGLGLWNVTNLEKRLDLQGMAPRKQAAPVRHPFMSVEGISYLVGNAELQVFIYENAAAMERDVARLDTIAVAPRGTTVKWSSKPTLIRNNNLAAILLGRNELQIERVQRALMAGLPPSS